MDAAKVSYKSDGSLKFEAVTYSHNPSLLHGDQWHTAISLVDHDGVILYSAGWDSPRMNAKDVRVRLTGTGHFDPKIYESIAGAQIGNRC